LEDAAPAAHDVARTVAVVAIAVTISLSLADVTQLAFFPRTEAGVRTALLAVTLAIPLHLRHLVYGVRGARPPGGAWTLAILAAVTIAGAFLGGDGWLREFAPLAVSILIVLPGGWGIALAGAVVLAPLSFAGAHWYSTAAHPLSGLYCALAVAWRTVTQFVPLRLLASLRALDTASHELGARAVVQARVRIDDELRRTIEPALQQIIVRGERARALVDTKPERATAELHLLVGASRRGLSDARRIVASYRPR
jgi:hypothetical protein